MYIVNISFMVEPTVHDRWFDFIRKKYIPHCVELGFDTPVFTRLMSENNPGYYTYSIQVDVADVKGYIDYKERIIEEYTKLSSALFGADVTYFVSLLKKIPYES